MKLAIILSLLSLSLLSTLSLSAASKAPVNVLCDFIDKQNAIVKGHCIKVFDSYPTIHQATFQGVALIANNVAKRKLKTFITSMKRYQSTPSVPQQQKKSTGACLNLMRDINDSLEGAVDLIMKRQYAKAVNIERKLMKNILTTCRIRKTKSNSVAKSFAEFVVADVVAYKAILLLRPKKL